MENREKLKKLELFNLEKRKLTGGKKKAFRYVEASSMKRKIRFTCA